LYGRGNGRDGSRRNTVPKMASERSERQMTKKEGMLQVERGPVSDHEKNAERMEAEDEWDWLRGEGCRRKDDGCVWPRPKQ
jgi:hypothetical protein